jgi:glycosyltransferase involved in cell wall biosynthesis
LQEGDSSLHILLRAIWLGPFWRQMFSRADHLTAISGYLKKFALRNGAKNDIEIVPNGVDPEKFKSASDKLQVEEIKKKLGIKEADKAIITVSRLVKKNGVGDVIDALALLPEDYKFLILGSGPLEESLKSKAKNLKLESRVLFLGNIPNKEVPRYLAASDIFVRPSLSEGLGNSFLEAMAAGVPVIGTPVGGIPDFLQDPSAGSGQATGLFCKVKDPKSIAEKIKILAEDESLREKIIENGKKLVAEKYNWDLIAQKMREVFDKI